MQEDHTYKSWKEVFDGAESPMDLDAAWSALEAKRKPKRRFAFFWWWGAGLVLLVVAALAFWPQPTIDAFRIPGADLSTQANWTNSSVAPVATEMKENLNTNTRVIPNITSNSTSKPGAINSLAQNQIGFDRIENRIKMQLPTRASLRNLPPLPPSNILQVQHPISTIRSADPAMEIIPPTSSGWSIGFGLSYAKSFRTLSANDPDIQDWLNKRADGEEILDQQQFQMYVEKALGKQFFVRLGYRFNNRVDRLEEQIAFENIVFIEDQLLEVVNFADGSTEEIYGPLELTEFNRAGITNYQRTQTHSLDFSVGYALSLNARLRTRWTLGASYGFFNQKRGRSYAKDLDIGTYSAFAANDFRSSGVWEALASWEVAYAVPGGIDLTAGLSAGTMLNSVAQNKWTERYHFVGGSIGLRQSF